MPRLPRVLPALTRATTRPLLPITQIARITHPRMPMFPVPFIRSFASSHIRLTSSSPPPSEPPRNLSGRLKTLIKEYGWYALGVYLILSTLDFGVAFAAINLLGAEYVASLAATVKNFLYDLIGYTPSERPDSNATEGGGHEGLYAMLVLAYTIHKTLFLPVRVGLTAAVTPKLVGWLRRRGWSGAQGARRAGQEIRERVRRSSRGSNGQKA